MKKNGVANVFIFVLFMIPAEIIDSCNPVVIEKTGKVKQITQRNKSHETWKVTRGKRVGVYLDDKGVGREI